MTSSSASLDDWLERISDQTLLQFRWGTRPPPIESSDRITRIGCGNRCSSSKTVFEWAVGQELAPSLRVLSVNVREPPVDCGPISAPGRFQDKLVSGSNADDHELEPLGAFRLFLVELGQPPSGHRVLRMRRGGLKVLFNETGRVDFVVAIAQVGPNPVKNHRVAAGAGLGEHASSILK
ncbi:hypothetical protein BC828DRAFT_139990 [Blastocladiella britannica]|nr:hypothetical protein BC828DRAFT_139990 [Blastocladiella britannica]